MSAPHEIIAGPLTLWAGPVGTAFPKVDEVPAGPWKKIGAAGDKNYDDEGVTVTASQTIEGFTPAGGTHVRKAWRTEDGLVIGCNVVDFAPEQLALVYDNATVTNTAAGAGTAGTKTVKLGRGVEVALYALIAEGPSPVDNSMPLRFQVSSCYQSADSAEWQFQKGEPVGNSVEFTAIEAAAGEFAELVVMTAEPTG